MFRLKFRKQLIIKSFIFSALCFFISAMAAQAQVCKGPILKDRLLVALKSKMQNAQQLANYINQCGVDFQVTPDVESELVAAGARPVVITAARNNYRAPVTAPPSRPTTGSSGNTGGSGTVAGGAPLTKEAIVTLLENGVSDAKVQQNVKVRGVAFQLNPTVAKEIKAAGGSDALIGLMAVGYRAPDSGYDPNIGGGNRPGRTTSSANSYEDLVNQAIETYNRDATSNQPMNSPNRLAAIEILKKAIALEPNNPLAYQSLGFETLYGTSKGFDVSEEYYNKAIELGGSAVLRVYHDHNGVFTDTCNGSLYISKDGVRFESDDNKHTFDVKDDDIKQVKTNSSFIKVFQTKPGSYKIVLKSGDNKNFNFAPLTGSNDESKMVIRLIGK